MRKIQLIVPLATLLLSACASTYDIKPDGQGNYRFTEQDSWDKYTKPEMVVNAAKRANAHCEGLGKKMEVVSKEFKKDGVKKITFVFRCN